MQLIFFSNFHKFYLNFRAIAVYPNGNKKDTENILCVFLYIYQHLPLQVKFKVSFIDLFGTEQFMNRLDQMFESTLGRGWRIVSRDDLIKPENALLKDDTLTLLIEVISVNRKLRNK
jgi:hypothetical protein